MSVHTKYTEPQVTRGPIESITVAGRFGSAVIRPFGNTAEWDIALVSPKGNATGRLCRADLEYLLHRLHQLHEDLRMVEQAAEFEAGSHGR